VGDFNGTGQIKSGMNIKSIVAANFNSGFIAAAFWVRDIVINGNYGQVGVFGEARIDALAAATMSVGGTNAGLINVERDFTSLTSGNMNGAQVRAGNTLGSITAGSMNEVRISVGDSLGPVTVAGNATDTQILSGGDLGSDVAPGGTGFGADRATSGSIGVVSIGGNFERSSLVAGLLRGGRRLLRHDRRPGRSGPLEHRQRHDRRRPGRFERVQRAVPHLGNGHHRNRADRGRPGRQPGQLPRGAPWPPSPRPIRVMDLQITQESNNWKATFFFNQQLDTSTFGPAISVSEVRNGGLVSIALVQGR
jgi:hypothetical protein